MYEFYLFHRKKLHANLYFRYSVEDTSAKSETSSELRISVALRNDTAVYACSASSDIGADEAVIKLVVQGDTTIELMLFSSVTLNYIELNIIKRTKHSV